MSSPQLIAGGDSQGFIEAGTSNFLTIDVAAASPTNTGQIAPPAQQQPPPSGPSGPGVGSAVGQVLTGVLTGAMGGIAAGAISNAINHGKNKNQTANSTPKLTGQVVTAKGLSLRYPKDWKLNKAVLELDGPIALLTFAKYQQGGIIPDGGAQIDVTMTLLKDSAANEMERDLGPSDRQATTVGNLAGLRANYEDAFAPMLKFTNTAIYVARNHVLYKFFLTFHKDDSNAAKYVAEFDTIMSSVVFQN